MASKLDDERPFPFLAIAVGSLALLAVLYTFFFEDGMLLQFHSPFLDGPVGNLPWMLAVWGLLFATQWVWRKWWRAC
jgi:hypothetical protein